MSWPALVFVCISSAIANCISLECILEKLFRVGVQTCSGSMYALVHVLERNYDLERARSDLEKLGRRK
jgi:hypothetical protein